MGLYRPKIDQDTRNNVKIQFLKYRGFVKKLRFFKQKPIFCQKNTFGFTEFVAILYFTVYCFAYYTGRKRKVYIRNNRASKYLHITLVSAIM